MFSGLIEENRALIERFTAMYSECKECYKDTWEMQMCIEEDLMCNGIFDETEQEILAKHIVNKIFG